MNNFLKSTATAAFSLIELLVIVAIIALLIAIALPSYRNYQAQSQVSEIFSFAAGEMATYQEHTVTGAPFDSVLTNLGDYIAVVEITGNGGTPTAGGRDGTVYMELNTDSDTGAASINSALSGLKITFTPHNNPAAAKDNADYVELTWVCTFDPNTSSNPAKAASLLSSGKCTAQNTNY